MRTINGVIINTAHDCTISKAAQHAFVTLDELEAWAYERATLYSLIDMAGAELENLIKFTDPMIRNRIIKLVGLLKEQSEMEFEEA